MEAKAKRGRAGKKAEAEEVAVELNDVELEPVKNGGNKKKPAAKSGKAAKEVAVEPVDVVEATEDKKKPAARKGKAAAAVEVDPLEVTPAAPEEASKGRKGRKPAAAKEEPVVEEAPVAKKGGRGRKAAEPEPEVAPPPAKKGKAAAEAVENGTSPAAAPKGRGRGKVAKEVAAEPEPEPEAEVVAAPTKRGRGKAKAETKEPEEEAAPSPAKKSKQVAKEPSPKKPSPKKAATPAPEPVSEEPKETAAASKAGGRGRKKAAPVDEKPASPAQSPTAPAKRGRGKKAAAEPEANGTVKAAVATKKSSKKVPPVKAQADDLVPTNGVTQRKKKKVEQQDDGAAVVEEPKAKRSKTEKKPAAPKMNKSATDYTKLSFDLDGKDFNFKISSWNVAGLRGWVEKGGLEYFEHEKPDILCVQETKCADEQLPESARHVKGYHPYWLCMPGGYAGVAIYSKKMPINVTYGLGDEEQDVDGRLLTAEYEKFYLVCVYVPNAGRKLVTLPKRLRWDEKFHQYLKDLDSKKPVIMCGDLNVAHEEIDLANPKTNRKNAGFTQEERDGMSKLLSLGFVDTFRRLYPEQKSAYTFWTYMGNSRAKNVGWRLDYFIASERLESKVVDNVIRSGVYGSDHCPITLFLQI